MVSKKTKPNNGNGNHRTRKSGNGGDPHVTTHTLISPLPSLSTEQLLQRLGQLGLVNEEIASVFGVTIDKFQEVLFFNPQLHDILNDAKEHPNRKVEASLFKRALGYSIKEIHKVEGKPVKVVIKEIAPDVLAEIFWLKNRDPKRWRDTLEVRHTLRDRMSHAHDALRLGSSGPLSLPPGKDTDEDAEA